MNKHHKTALNMAKFIQEQSLLLLEKLNDLESWSWIQKRTYANGFMRTRNVFMPAFWQT